MSITRNLNLILNKVSVIKEKLFSQKYLLYTNVTISISLSAMGDVLEQHYEILKVFISNFYSNAVFLFVLIYN